MFTAQDLVNNMGNEANILNIFRTNVVMSTYNASQNSNAVHTMSVEQGWGANPYIARTSDGTLIDVMSICNKPMQMGLNTFQAYWCPYQGNDCKLAWLDNAASYMFTAKMDGCTFAVGSEAPSGARMVAHANLGGKGAEQFNLIKGQIAFRRDAGMRYLGPGAYRVGTGSGGTEATTFGLRLATGQWRFFTQVVMIDKDAKTMKLLAVAPIA